MSITDELVENQGENPLTEGPPQQEPEQPQEPQPEQPQEAPAEQPQPEKSPNTNDKTSRYVVMVSAHDHKFDADPEQVLVDADWQYVEQVTVSGNGGQRDARRRAIEGDEDIRKRVETAVEAESGPWFLALPHSSVKPKAPRAEAPRKPRVIY